MTGKAGAIIRRVRPILIEHRHETAALDIPFCVYVAEEVDAKAFDRDLSDRRVAAREKPAAHSNLGASFGAVQTPYVGPAVSRDPQTGVLAEFIETHQRSAGPGIFRRCNEPPARPPQYAARCVSVQQRLRTQSEIDSACKQVEIGVVDEKLLIDARIAGAKFRDR